MATLEQCILFCIMQKASDMTKIRKNQKAHEDQHARQRLVAQYWHETENELSDSVVKALTLAIGSVWVKEENHV